MVPGLWGYATWVMPLYSPNAVSFHATKMIQISTKCNGLYGQWCSQGGCWALLKVCSLGVLCCDGACSRRIHQGQTG